MNVQTLPHFRHISVAENGVVNCMIIKEMQDNSNSEQPTINIIYLLRTTVEIKILTKFTICLAQHVVEMGSKEIVANETVDDQHMSTPTRRRSQRLAEAIRMRNKRDTNVTDYEELDTSLINYLGNR
jgi:hypothetical protein